MRKVKITVIRKEFYPDFADKFLSDGKDAGGLLPIASGSTYYPWNKRDGQTIACCTDGIRPVVFKIEAITQA